MCRHWKSRTFKISFFIDTTFQWRSFASIVPQFFYHFIYYYKKIKSIEAIGCLDLENLSVLFVSSEVALIPHFQKAILRRPILIGILILITLDIITIRQSAKYQKR
jgi:hypothetical protein